MKSPPSLRARVLAGIAVLVLTTIIAWFKQQQAPVRWIAGDYTFHWRAARAIFDGQSPYDVIRPTGTYPWNDNYRYPLPAALVVLPIAWLRARQSAALFLGISAGLLTFGLTRRGFHTLLAFACVPFIYCFTGSQVTPLLMAASLLPGLGGLLVIKPTIGLALFASRPTRIGAAGAIALLLIAVAVLPSWPLQWLHAATAKSGAEGNYQIPLLLPGGPLLLAALLRWRRPEGRLLAVMAIVPQSFFFYDQFPLALVPQSRRELAIFGTLSVAALLVCQRILPYPEISVADTSHRVGTVCTLMMFIPCLVMILRRPNEGELPSWLERITRRLPSWIRGSNPSHDSLPAR